MSMEAYSESDAFELLGTCDRRTLDIELSPGLRLPVQWSRGGGDRLVVYFHGAIDRTRRPMPHFVTHDPLLSGSAHQLSLCDPSVLMDDQLTATWFAGHREFPLQKLLPSFFERAAAFLKVSRVVFVGASSGGFAALYYSAKLPGSVAVACNPQIILRRYGLALRYLERSWPGCSDSELPDVDLRAIYSIPFANSLVLLQSSGDRRHLHNHSAPFLEALHRKSHDRVVYSCGFYGKLGHPGSVSRQQSASWIGAALLSETILADDLLVTQHKLVQQWMAAAPRPKRAGETFSPADVTMTDLLEKSLSAAAR